MNISYDKNIILIIRLAVALIIWLAAILIQHLVPYSFEIELVYLSLYIVAYIISGYDILWAALKHIISGNFLDEYFLITNIESKEKAKKKIIA